MKYRRKDNLSCCRRARRKKPISDTFPRGFCTLCRWCGLIFYLVV